VIITFPASTSPANVTLAPLTRGGVRRDFEGSELMEPGKYDNISLIEYHDLPSWSKSTLDKIHKSPAHFLEWRNRPKESTAAMDFGRALHCAVLTPELYSNEYAIFPSCDRRTKEGKAIYQEFVDKSAGKEPISSSDAAKVERMKGEIFSHPLASSLLNNGEAEQSFFWIDPHTNLECKARPDYLTLSNICIDLKVSNSAEYHTFQRTAYKFRYHVQGAFFIDGIFHATGRRCDDFVLVVIEDEAPHGIMVYVFDDLAINAGRKGYQSDLETIVDWQGNPDLYKTVYQSSTEPIELSLPPWAE
jgi:hypothetical protein